MLVSCFACKGISRSEAGILMVVLQEDPIAPVSSVKTEQSLLSSSHSTILATRYNNNNFNDLHVPWKKYRGIWITDIQTGKHPKSKCYRPSKNRSGFQIVSENLTKFSPEFEYPFINRTFINQKHKPFEYWTSLVFRSRLYHTYWYDYSQFNGFRTFHR